MSSKHCKTEECKKSASMLCDHESVLSMQYLVDQTKRFLAQAQHPQPSRVEMFSGLAFDNGRVQTCSYPRVPSSVPSKLDEFYMTPCSVPSYNNAQVCNAEACCSRVHQLFDNHTRNGTGSAKN